MNYDMVIVAKNQTDYDKIKDWADHMTTCGCNDPKLLSFSLDDVDMSLTIDVDDNFDFEIPQH